MVTILLGPTMICWVNVYIFEADLGRPKEAEGRLGLFAYDGSMIYKICMNEGIGVSVQLPMAVSCFRYHRA